MLKRWGLVLAIFAVAGAVVAAPGLAHKKHVKTTLSIVFGPNPPGGTFSGTAETRGNRFCAERRTVKLFRDGVQVGRDQTDNFGKWIIGLSTLPGGTYVAKVTQHRLPAALQHKPGRRHRIICKAATSAAVPILD